MLTWPTVNESGLHLTKFIQDVRYDLNAPALPFVTRELGQHGPSELLDAKNHGR
jgi:hypothetical protein